MSDITKVMKTNMGMKSKVRALSWSRAGYNIKFSGIILLL